MYNKPYDGAEVGHLECYATIDNLYYTLNGWYEEDLVGEYAVGEHIDESTCYYIYGNQFSSGEVAYKLNGNTSEGDLVWGQTIGTDSYPVLGARPFTTAQTVQEYPHIQMHLLLLTTTLHLLTASVRSAVYTRTK